MAALTTEKVKPHKKTSRKRKCRYFSCAQCKRQWRTKVSRVRPVSQCRKCNRKYWAIPYEQEPKIGKHKCSCGNTFTGWTSEGVMSPCYQCDRNILPEKLLTPRPIRRKTDKTHNCNLCDGKGNCPNKQPVVVSRLYKGTEPTKDNW